MKPKSEYYQLKKKYKSILNHFEKYLQKQEFKLPKRPGMSGPGWSHLVIADGRLYVRHSDVLLVYDIRAK